MSFPPPPPGFIPPPPPGLPPGHGHSSGSQMPPEGMLPVPTLYCQVVLMFSTLLVIAQKSMKWVQMQRKRYGEKRKGGYVDMGKQVRAFVQELRAG